MQFLRTTMLLIVNLCLPFKGNLVPARENRILEPQMSRDEPDAESPDLLQEFLRMDVEFAMFEANLKMYEHERLREYFKELAKELRRRNLPKRDWIVGML